MLSTYASAAALALAAGLLSAPASAAPLGLNGAKAPGTSNVEQAAYRRCWRHNGHLRCRYVGDADPYYYDDDYRYYGYGPVIGFGFGGGRHFHGGHGVHGGHIGGAHGHR
jgi:hypothetical protein